MSEAIAFDSHRFVKKLTACGFTEKQAEGLADEQIRLLDGNLASKADLERVKGELQTEIQVRTRQVKSDLEVRIQKVNANLETRIESVKADLMKWMLAAVTAQMALLAGVIVGLVRFF
ncbi:MAG: DUF1640 domain-containing protein [Proteobacteria bacterium]|nr:DUF1640 domain-containing protein [Pseudomonadota bacterium]